METNVIDRFTKAGVAEKNISFLKDSFTFKADFSPTEFLRRFRNYYGPTINAFEAAEKNGKADDLQHELETLFNSLNQSPDKNKTLIPASFLRVTVVK